jgi:protein gp37
MAVDTGIKWTDSTSNPWWGCTKVEGAPACIDCYAEKVDERGTAAGTPLHWGLGAPRRRVSEKARNEPFRWQRNADKFFATHERRQRVFTMSMGDLFDNEVDDDWRNEHFDLMTACDRLEWQICTKRLTQIPKMVPREWMPTVEGGPRWPKHIGVLITVVTQVEADRDVPRLHEMQRRFGIPWVGISYEPAQEFVYLGHQKLDWIIFGGKSGGNWNDGPFDLDWARKTRDLCSLTGTAFFMKQVAAFQPNDAMIPADLMIRQWPKGH